MKIKFKRISVIDHVKTGQEAVRHRKRRSISQTALCEQLKAMGIVGMSQGMVSYLESGLREWTPEAVENYNRAIDALESNKVTQNTVAV